MAANTGLDINVLLREIDKKREMMITTALATSFTSEETIKCSQELDLMINQYQRFNLIEKRTGIYGAIMSVLALFVLNPYRMINKIR
ncbi:aspartyl-phosphate phosphatase Spo0E family protein [Bacillus sp. DJP31]|uniref:aspartyl-phosphate phosphatase Spo0E family protein n=1 Tax=Bacillus sp. DJP31 TaxID=3409789 RepID=UPI003BB63E13